MNLKDRLAHIANFLKPYQRIWQNEIMLMYPHPFEGYPIEWLDEIASIKDPESVIKLEKKEVTQLLTSPDLLHYYNQIERLSHFEEIPALPSMPSDRFTFLYMVPKKKYEIQRLAPFVQDFFIKHQLNSVVDIGGGVGLLAQSLNNEYKLKVTSLDMDPVLQDTGRKRHAYNAKHPENQVQFIPVKVDEKSPELSNLLTPLSLSIGLHTCGQLAIDQIKASAKYKSAIINFGCCYHKMVKDPETQNISHFARSIEDKVVMSQYALTLATRAHRRMSPRDLDFKLKVKFYRYAFHILLHDEYKMEDPMTLGNSTEKLYESSFDVYAFEQLRRIKVSPRHTPSELNEFFNQSKIQDVIWKMLAAGLVRNALGRLLEAYILLDRAIYLEEQGYIVSIKDFFDEEFSPRNLGLVAHLETSNASK